MPKLAQEELKTLTAAPHVAASKEDYDTAVYVASKFKAAGLDTPDRSLQGVAEFAPGSFSAGQQRRGEDSDDRAHAANTSIPTPYQDDPRILPAFNGSSPSCDLTADVVYVNYGRPEDFKRLDDMHISLAGKIVLVRYGMNFRGVKVYLAEQRGAAGVIIYSDPADDGYFQGDKYPRGPVAPGYQRAARVGAIHVQISRGRLHAGYRFNTRIAGVAAFAAFHK